ncbi:hypothetical protein [Micromonospora sp. NPDC005203]|uniref:restriction endonuclease subunit S n=1 Tax=Micromonospora sp. NPDC005203 TaxID=3364226 RepID=UPI00368CF9C7
MAKLSELASINPRIVDKPNLDDVVAFLPMAVVDAELGTAVAREERSFRVVSKGFTLFEDRDILVAKITPCFENGKIAQAELSTRIGAGSTEFHVVRPDRSRVNERFLLHLLRHPRIRTAGEQRMTGSAGQRRVPASYIAGLEMPVPPLPEQERAADVLDSVNGLRVKRRAALTRLRMLTQSIFLELFGDPVRNDRGWPRVPLGSLLQQIQSGHSPRCMDRPVVDGEWGVLKLGAVTSCEFNPDQNKALPHGIEPHLEDEVQAGDLLFSRKNTRELVAACVLVQETVPRLLMPDLIFRLKLADKADVDPAFLHQLLIFPSKRRVIQNLAGGSAGSMPNISKAKLREVQIELPPLSLQREFARQLESIEKMKTAQRQHLAELDSLFASLQDRAFRGEL